MICIGRGIVVVAIQSGFRGYFALGSSEIKRSLERIYAVSLNVEVFKGEEKSSEGQE